MEYLAATGCLCLVSTWDTLTSTIFSSGQLHSRPPVAHKGLHVRICEECVLGKAKKTSVPKVKLERANRPGERIFIDISSPTTKSIGGSRHWLLVLDDYSDYPMSFFISHKDM